MNIKWLYSFKISFIRFHLKLDSRIRTDAGAFMGMQAHANALNSFNVNYVHKRKRKMGDKVHLFKPGNPGKPKGATNLITRTVRETVLAVFNDLQADPKANLLAWATREPTQFYQIAAKLIPTEVVAQVEHTGGVQIYIPDNSRDGKGEEEKSSV